MDAAAVRRDADGAGRAHRPVADRRFKGGGTQRTHRAFDDREAVAAEAKRIGEAGRRLAAERFSIDRFVRDWDAALRLVTS